MIRIESIAVGPFQANCHIVHCTETREAIVVDPGEEADAILERLRALNLRVSAIWLTHAHIDHIGAMDPVRRATGAEVWLHELEADWPANPAKNLGVWLGLTEGFGPADRHWKGGENIEALGASWTVEHLPGHSPGHVAYVCAGHSLALSGDLVMQGSIGRTDFPGSDERAMTASLRRVLQWPDARRLHVGHGPATTIGDERRTNWILRETAGIRSEG